MEMFRFVTGLAFLSTLSLGCAQPVEQPERSTNLCEDAWDLPSGTVTASVLGAEGFAAFDGRYSTQDGVGISATDGSTSLTLSTRVTDERDLTWGRFPALSRVGLSSSDAYALVYRSGGAYVSNAQHTGWLVLAGTDDDDLVGCFELEVSALDGDEVHTFVDGLLHVPRL